MSHPVKNATSIFALGATALLGACASIPAPLAGSNFVQITPQQSISQSPSGQRVRWGGEIIKVEPRADRTCFEILSRDLWRDARPNRHDHSNGRFLACKSGFYDPEIYGRGRDVTVVGALGASEKHKVGKFDYTFAVVAADEIYMWPKRTTFPASYYDPWSVGFADPFWGPGWGWRGGWGYGGYWGPRW